RLEYPARAGSRDTSDGPSRRIVGPARAGEDAVRMPGVEPDAHTGLAPDSSSECTRIFLIHHRVTLPARGCDKISGQLLFSGTSRVMAALGLGRDGLRVSNHARK